MHAISVSKIVITNTALKSTWGNTQERGNMLVEKSAAQKDFGSQVFACGTKRFTEEYGIMNVRNAERSSFRKQVWWLTWSATTGSRSTVARLVGKLLWNLLGRGTASTWVLGWVVDIQMWTIVSWCDGSRKKPNFVLVMFIFLKSLCRKIQGWWPIDPLVGSGPALPNHMLSPTDPFTRGVSSCALLFLETFAHFSVPSHPKIVRDGFAIV